MRTCIFTPGMERALDAFAHNPGNLYALYGQQDFVPLSCPYSPAERWQGFRDYDYLIHGPKGWAFVKDGIRGWHNMLDEVAWIPSLPWKMAPLDSAMAAQARDDAALKGR